MVVALETMRRAAVELSASRRRAWGVGGTSGTFTSTRTSTRNASSLLLCDAHAQSAYSWDISPRTRTSTKRAFDQRRRSRFIVRLSCRYLTVQVPMQP